MPRQPSAPEQIAARLRHVRWIGGGSGAGKTTIARQLAATHGFRHYSTDDRIAEHVRRSNPSDHPLIHAFLAMDMDQRWVNRPPATMLATFPWFQGEGFDFILEDLLALPPTPPTIVEGFRLLPRLVAPLLSTPNQAVWLFPSPDFRRTAFDSRGFTWDIPTKTTNPDRALSNLLARDHLFTSTVLREATASGLPVIAINGTHSLEAITRRVNDLFGFPTV